jgi:hypothetical protein
MPEEMEVPTEHLHESMEEKAEHTTEKWIFGVALSAALLAVFAAISSLLAGHHANEAIIEQLKAADQWEYYQSKGIKAAVLSSKVDLLEELGKPAKPSDAEKLASYKHEQAEIQEKAEENQHAAEAHLQRHNVLAKGVTAFQIAIALSAISVLTRKKPLWIVSLLLGLGGLAFLIMGSL